jgi:hypothetical protein
LSSSKSSARGPYSWAKSRTSFRPNPRSRSIDPFR